MMSVNTAQQITTCTHRIQHATDANVWLLNCLSMNKDLKINLQNWQKQRIILLAQALINLKSEKTIIEWAHIYVDNMDYQTFNDELSLFQQIKKVLCENNICNEGWLFIDNYTHKFQQTSSIKIDQQQVEDYLKMNDKNFISRIELEWWEEILSLSWEIIKQLKSQWKLSEKDWKIFLKRNNVLLFDKVKWKYSCALLDAAFSLIKYRHWDSIINILPLKWIWTANNEWFSSYQNQQYKVRTILREYNEMNPNIYPKFFNVYFDPTLLAKWIVDLRIWVPNFTRKFLKDSLWEQMDDSILI